jgi:hypothetical protein
VRIIEVLVDRDAVAASRASAAGEPWRDYDLGHGSYTFFEQRQHGIAKSNLRKVAMSHPAERRAGSRRVFGPRGRPPKHRSRRQHGKVQGLFTLVRLSEEMSDRHAGDLTTHERPCCPPCTAFEDSTATT